MYCIYCGTALPEDAVFCGNCGRQLIATASTTATDITFLPTPLSPEIGSNIGQPAITNVPMVQGTPQASSVPSVEGTPPAVSGSPTTEQAIFQSPAPAHGQLAQPLQSEKILATPQHHIPPQSYTQPEIHPYQHHTHSQTRDDHHSHP